MLWLGLQFLVLDWFTTFSRQHAGICSNPSHRLNSKEIITYLINPQLQVVWLDALLYYFTDQVCKYLFKFVELFNISTYPGVLGGVLHDTTRYSGGFRKLINRWAHFTKFASTTCATLLDFLGMISLKNFQNKSVDTPRWYSFARHEKILCTLAHD